MLQLQPGLLAPQMRDVIQYMLESTQVRGVPPSTFDHHGRPLHGLKRL